MPGANLTDRISRKYTPYSYQGKLTVNNSVTIDTLKSLNTIDLSNSKNGNGYNEIIAVVLDSSKLADIYPTGATDISLDLYKFSFYMIPDEEGNIKAAPVWTKVDSVSGKDGEALKFEKLEAAPYKIVMTAGVENGILNVSWNDEPINATGLQKGNYGSPLSILPPENYVIPSEDTIYTYPSN